MVSFNPVKPRFDQYKCGSVIININTNYIYRLISEELVKKIPETRRGRENIRSEILFQKWLTQAAATNNLAGSLDIIL